MVDETDGIEEAFEGQLRMLVTTAAQLGERIARAREDAKRRALAASEQEAREFSSRLAAEQRAARTQLANVYRSDWWDRATPKEIADTYQVAHAWKSEDMEAVRAEALMRDELRTRYGIAAPQGEAAPGAVRAQLGPQAAQGVDTRTEVQRAHDELKQLDPKWLESWDATNRGVDGIMAVQENNRRLLEHWNAVRSRASGDGAQGDAKHTQAAADRAEAVRLMQQADREERRAEEARAIANSDGVAPDEQARAAAEAEQRTATAASTRGDAGALYDSAERRDATARDLESKGIDRELVAARMRADVSQAKPATQAVAAGGPKKAPRARKVPGGRAAQTQRPGLAR